MKYMPIIEGRIRHRDIVIEFSQRVLKELGLGRLRTRPITIWFQRDAEGAFGYCIGDKSEVDIVIGRKHPVTGETVSFMTMMQTLAHELVHAKQYLRGELVSESKWVWKGRNADGFKYDNQPWEKEAHRLEKELFAKCFPFDRSFKN